MPSESNSHETNVLGRFIVPWLHAVWIELNLLLFDTQYPRGILFFHTKELFMNKCAKLHKHPQKRQIQEVIINFGRVTKYVKKLDIQQFCQFYSNKLD